MKATNKHKQLKLSGSNFAIPLAATIGLFAGGAAFLNPFSFGDNSYADSTSADISVNIGEVIMVPEVSQEAINLNLDPDVNGDFASDTVNVRVSTNHVSGYTLTMSTEDTETALTSSDFDSYKIDALGSKTSATDFANLSSTASINKWGYATDNNGDGEGQTEEGYYYGITNKDNPTTIKITDAPTSSSETNVTFATKGKDLAAGTYSNVVVFSAIGNALPETRALDDLEYMQDVGNTAAKICENSTTWTPENNKEYTLKDSRDNNEYVVRKLADGNCWMVSNLAITNTTISSIDSDLDNGNFTVPASSNDNYVNSESGSFMHIASTSDNFIDGSTIEPCFPDPLSGDFSCEDTTAPVISYSPTYGPYYNWHTATAGTGSTTNPNPTSSICPKGWKLPYGDTSSYSWNYLYSASYSANVSNFQAATNTGSAYWGGQVYQYGDRIAQASVYGNWLTRVADIFHGQIHSIYVLRTGNSSVDTNKLVEADGYYESDNGAIRCVLATE